MNKILYSQDHVNLVNKIKQARLDLGLDQKKAAALLGRTQSYVSKIESGQRRIDAIQLKYLAKIYKRKLDFFL